MHHRLLPHHRETPPTLPIPLPTSSPPLHLLSTDRRADRPEVTFRLEEPDSDDYASSRETCRLWESLTLGINTGRHARHQRLMDHKLVSTIQSLPLGYAKTQTEIYIEVGYEAVMTTTDWLQASMITDLQVAYRRRQASNYIDAGGRTAGDIAIHRGNETIRKDLQTQNDKFESQQDKLKVLHSQMHQGDLQWIYQGVTAALQHVIADKITNAMIAIFWERCTKEFAGLSHGLKNGDSFSTSEIITVEKSSSLLLALFIQLLNIVEPMYKTFGIGCPLSIP
ncbi:hypothetical protein Tco_0975521 [Tanacetum coccineum]|uniref:Uncharacterized protein n=1 Tax=Tanacetum coccineum TaxID=301880 RepID=A0ABQ5EEL3_9ASTR